MAPNLPFQAQRVAAAEFPGFHFGGAQGPEVITITVKYRASRKNVDRIRKRFGRMDWRWRSRNGLAAALDVAAAKAKMANACRL
jgi:hypothetical protein